MHNTLYKRILQIVCVVFAVLLIRLVYVDIYNYLRDSFEFQSIEYFSAFFSNIYVVLLTFIVDILVVVIVNRFFPYRINSFKRVLFNIILIIAMSAIDVFFINSHLSQINNITSNIVGWHILFCFMSALLINTIIVSITNLFIVQNKTNKLMGNEKNQQVKFSYPNRIYNSVCSSQSIKVDLLQMKDFIQSNELNKLELFINSLYDFNSCIEKIGEENIVMLQDELKCINLYIEKIKLRYQDKINVSINIDNKFNQKYIASFSLLLLLNNTVSNYIVETNEPLHITISMGSSNLVLTSNSSISMLDGNNYMGLNNIISLCKNAINKEINYNNSNGIYVVEIPVV